MYDLPHRQLTTPAIPASLPPALSVLPGLQTLQLTGDGTAPQGPLPLLPALATLQLESTALGALPDAFFAANGSTGITTLTLVRNAQMGGGLPGSILGTRLQNL